MIMENLVKLASNAPFMDFLVERSYTRANRLGLNPHVWNKNLRFDMELLVLLHYQHRFSGFKPPKRSHARPIIFYGGKFALCLAEMLYHDL